MNLKSSETKINLMRAFAGESMARNRYNMAASAANKEGHFAVGRIFDFTAKQEQAHATVFYNFLKEENDTHFDITASNPVKLNQGVSAIIYTIAVIGSAEISASLIFVHSSFNGHTSLFYFVLL